VFPSFKDQKFETNYRKTPYLIQAAQQGNLDSVQLLLQKGCDLKEVGHICLSRRKHNSTSSNLVGAAAYYGNSRVLKFIISRLGNSTYEQVNFKALECSDIRPLKTGPFSPEFESYTPLMLSICSEHGSLDIVKQLLTSGADFKVHDKSSGDNIIHLSARWSAKIEIIEYLVKSLSSDLLFERNEKGETPLSIASNLKNSKMTKLLEDLQVSYDKTRQKAGDLLASLEAEEEKNERERLKKKDKKYRAKLLKIAEKDDITLEEVEKRIRLKQEKKLQDEQ
jgi:hypothetical protein